VSEDDDAEELHDPEELQPKDGLEFKSFEEYDPKFEDIELPSEWVGGYPPLFNARALIRDLARADPEDGYADHHDRIKARLCQVKMMMQKYWKVFVTDPDNPGRTDRIECDIELVTNKPIYSRPFRCSPHERELLRQHVATMLKNNLIEPSKSEWAAPAFLIPKKGGKLRFVIDYRRLNTACMKEGTPLPRIDDALRSFHGMKWFSLTDCAWGYWAVPMTERSKPLTAFITPDGLYQWKVMPFGLAIAPG
jgi:hypothetical protein